MRDAEALNRWRLMLGRYADSRISFSEGDELHYAGMDDVLDFLYGREYGEDRGMRGGGIGPSALTVPEWITKIRELFPKETVEVLEKHALNKYELAELLTDQEVLQKLEPNMDLLKSILQMKHLMKGEVLNTARKIVGQIVEEIRRKLDQEVKAALTGRIDINSTGRVQSYRNLDMKKTIKRNLMHYNLEDNQLVIDKVYFNKRVQFYNPWRVIITVDESGSMMGSVIHSAVMAGIFAKLPMLRTHLVIFDTEVVDLSGYIDDPVEALMSIQLGGGTHIAKALQYSYSLIENPYRTMVILISDLCEGGPVEQMYAQAKSIIETGAKLMVLTSLDYDATPVHDTRAAKTLAEIGANVASLTPGGLAKWIAEIIS